MTAFVHVARVLPGKRDEFVQRIKDGFSADPQGLRAFGFTRIVSFTTPEASSEGEELLVTIYEAEDASVIERFYSLEPVLEQERRAHGTLVAHHDHAAVPNNAAFLDIRFDESQ